MPTYVYKCESCGVQFEQFQSFKDDPLTDCPYCTHTEAVRRVFQPVGIVFKGSGWYINDSRPKQSDEKSSGSSSSASETTSSNSSTASSDTATPDSTGSNAANTSTPSTPSTPAASTTSSSAAASAE